MGDFTGGWLFPVGYEGMTTFKEIYFTEVAKLGGKFIVKNCFQEEA